MAPLITIGIPTFNRRQLLQRAIESIYRQTYRNIEIVVSDNQSTDDTANFLASQSDARMRVITQPYNIGMAGNFNACLTAASGELFVMLSDDDFLAPRAIEELSKPFRETYCGVSPEGIGVSWTPCTNVGASGDALWTVHGGPPLEDSLAFILGVYEGTRGPQLCSVMLRTKDAKAVGYDEEVYGVLSDSIPWSITALKYARVACVGQSLVFYTVHNASGSAAASCADWQRYVSRQVAALAAARRGAGDPEGARLIEARRENALANITVTVLMRQKGQRGWARSAIKEVWKSRSFMITPFVLRRCLVDGWKLLRLRG